MNSLAQKLWIRVYWDGRLSLKWVLRREWEVCGVGRLGRLGRLGWKVRVVLEYREWEVLFEESKDMNDYLYSARLTFLGYRYILCTQKGMKLGGFYLARIHRKRFTFWSMSSQFITLLLILIFMIKYITSRLYCSANTEFPFKIFIILLTRLQYAQICSRVQCFIPIMKKYGARSPAPIEQQPSSRQHTIQVCPQQPPSFTWQSHQHRLSLIQSLLSSPSKQWRQILSKWPHEQVTKLVTSQCIIQLKNRSLLVGNIANGRVHGFGLMISGKEGFYEGEIQNNCKHGMGYEATARGVYIGMFINNKREGRGVFLGYQNGEEYSGQFVHGRRSGYGAWKTNKEKYVGEWREDRPEGAGTFQSEGSKYQGEVREGVKHGQGKEYFSNGDKYFGNYENGRPDGFGQYVWSQNGAKFQGQFKNGLRHGKGTWSSNGDKYEGSYVNDRKCGYGQFRWASGNSYLGEYFNDLRHGNGRMNWVDGSWYQGEWKDGIQHGHGQLHEVNKPPRKGYFENNVLVKEEDFDRKKYKIQRTYAPKKVTQQRKTDSNILDSSRKLPSISFEKGKVRRYSLRSVKKKVTPNNRSVTEYICKSQKEYPVNVPIVNNWRGKVKSQKKHSKPDPESSLDMIQWSHIYSIKTQHQKKNSFKRR